MSICKTFGLDRSFLTRLLRTTALSLALVMASAAGVRAEIVIVGDNGANGADGVIIQVVRDRRSGGAGAGGGIRYGLAPR